MKETDLRIGSLVEYNGYTMSVYSIIGAYPREDPRFSDKVLLDLFDGAGLITATLDEIKPVPLTEEWLLKFRFVKSSNQLMFLPMPKIKAELHYEKHNYGNVITIQSDFGMLIPDDIKYIHQLQNLYFALTGEELELTP